MSLKPNEATKGLLSLFFHFGMGASTKLFAKKKKSVVKHPFFLLIPLFGPTSFFAIHLNTQWQFCAQLSLDFSQNLSLFPFPASWIAQSIFSQLTLFSIINKCLSHTFSQNLALNTTHPNKSDT